MRGCGSLALAAIALPILLVIGFFAVPATLIAERKNIHYRVDLRIGTKAVAIDRTVHCSPFFNGEISAPFAVTYRADRAALTLRLPDGSGVIVIPPNFCYWNIPMAEGTVPVVALVDNVSDPHRIDLYISPTRLAETNGPVQVIRFAAEETTSRGSSGMDEEFVLWGLDNVTVERPPSQNDLAGAILFRAVYGSAVGLEQDEQPLVPQFARNLTSTAIIPGHDVQRAWMDRHRNFHIATLQDGSGALWPRRSYDVTGKDNGLSIVPFTQNGQGDLEPDTRNRGVITSFRYPQDDDPQWLPTLASGGSVFPLVPLNGSSLYLPESKAVLALNADYFWLKLLPASGQ